MPYMIRKANQIRNFISPSFLCNRFRLNSSSASNFVALSKCDDSGFTSLKLNRPKVNSFNLEFLTEILKALDQVEKENSKGVIITSSLKVFSGGLDLTEFATNDDQRLRAFWGSFQDLWLKVYSLKVPVVCAINGHAPAGGCVLATCCDYRMVDGYTIGLNEAQFGLIAPFWVQNSFRNTVGTRNAEYGLTTGKLFKTQEAHSIGLVDEIATDAEDAISKSVDALRIWQKVVPSARHISKMMIRQQAIDELVNRKEDDIDTIVKHVMNDKFQTMVSAYLASVSARKK